MVTGVLRKFKKIIKGNLRRKPHPSCYDVFLLILWKRALYKVLWRFNQVLRSFEDKNFEPGITDVVPANVQNISPLVSFAYFC